MDEHSCKYLDSYTDYSQNNLEADVCVHLFFEHRFYDINGLVPQFVFFADDGRNDRVLLPFKEVAKEVQIVMVGGVQYEKSLCKG